MFIIEFTLTFYIFISCLCRKSPAIQLATKISLAWYLRNYVYVRHLVTQLPPLLACAFFCNLQSFRRYLLIFIMYTKYSIIIVMSCDE